MILDSLENIDKYDFATPQIVDFIRSLNVNTPCGRYDIDSDVFANIDVYNTKSELDCMLEGHRKYIDVQFLLYGEERINFINIDGLKIYKNYDHIKDIVFFKKPKTELNKIYLNGMNFAVFYPDDAHAPQITTLSPMENVKKVVIKIAVEWDL